MAKKPTKKPGSSRKGAAKDHKKKQIALAIAACADKNGDIRVAKVIETARNPKHILHSAFEWNTTKLVQKALEDRAAELIRECRTILNYREHVLVYPTYVNNPRGAERRYTPTLHIAKHTELKTLALKAELERIKSAIHRARSLAIVFDLDSNFQVLLDEIVRIETSIP